MQHGCRVLFEEYFRLERFPIRKIEEPVGVPCIAVGAPEFTAAIWVDRPIEWKSARDGSIQNTTDLQRQVLDISVLSARRGVGFRPTQDERLGMDGEDGLDVHLRLIFAFSNLPVKAARVTILKKTKNS